MTTAKQARARARFKAASKACSGMKKGARNACMSKKLRKK